MTRRPATPASSAVRSPGSRRDLRPSVWPTTRDECRELRPAPMLRKPFTVTRRVARARVYTSGLAYNHLRSTARASPIPSSTQPLPITAARCSTPSMTSRNCCALARTSSRRNWGPASSTAPPAPGTGAGIGPSGARRRSCSCSCTSATRTAPTGGASDASWRVSAAGPRRYDSYYLGETYDARREIAGWDRAGFDDSAWAAGAHRGRAGRCPSRPGARADPRRRRARTGATARTRPGNCGL